MADSPLFAMQAPKGVPLSSAFEAISDPLLPPQGRQEMLAHFWDEIYDLSPESHLSRLLAVILGDPGVGQLRKQYTYSHLSASLATARFYDIDRLFADVFGFRRFLAERLPFDPFENNGTASEWEAVLAADATYRNRVEHFVRGVNRGATLPGLYAVSEAVLGHPVRIYELFHFLDDSETYESNSSGLTNTYEELEAKTYAELETMTYGELEGASAYQGRSFESRTEFIVRPLRTITAEEKYHLNRALSRLKPAGTMLTIDPSGITIDTPTPAAAAYSPSSYWHVRSEVAAQERNRGVYPRYSQGRAVEQPRAAFSEYQGEEWYYPTVVSVTSYSQEGETIRPDNFERVVDYDGRVRDYEPEQAMASASDLSRARLSRDGILVAPVFDRSTK